MGDVTVNLFRTFGGWGILAAISSSVSAFGLVVLIFLQWKANITNGRAVKAANAAVAAAEASAHEARTANEKASEESNIRLRAWVNIGMLQEDIVQAKNDATIASYDSNTGLWDNDPTDRGFVKANPGASVVFNVPLRNSGATPAASLYVVEILSRSEIVTWNQMYQNASLGPGLLGPGTEVPNRFTIPLESFARYRTNLAEPEYPGIAVVYLDQFGDAWITGSVFRLRGREISMVQSSPPMPFDKEALMVPLPWREHT